MGKQAAEPESASAKAEAQEYNPLEWESVLAHIKIVSNEKVAQSFKNKETLAVFFNAEFIGTIQRPNGNERWTAKFSKRGESASNFKRMTDAVFFLIEDHLEKALAKRPKLLEAPPAPTCEKNHVPVKKVLKNRPGKDGNMS